MPGKIGNPHPYNPENHNGIKKPALLHRAGYRKIRFCETDPCCKTCPYSELEKEFNRWFVCTNKDIFGEFPECISRYGICSYHPDYRIVKERGKVL